MYIGKHEQLFDYKGNLGIFTFLDVYVLLKGHQTQTKFIKQKMDILLKISCDNRNHGRLEMKADFFKSS